MGLAPLGDVTFVVPRSEYVTEQLPLLRELGDIDDHTLTAGPETTGTARDTRYDAILTFSERMLDSTAHLANSLGLPFHNPKTVRLLTSKSAQRQRLHEAGVDSVRCHEITNPDEWEEAVAHVGLPAVLKPVRGEGSRNTLLIEHEQDGRHAVAEYFRRAADDDGSQRPANRQTPPIQLEEYLRGRDETPFGDYVSVECAASGGEVVALAVTGKYPQLKPFREIGQFWPSHLRSDEQQQVAQLAKDAVDALGVRIGLTHTEIKLTETGPHIIEVNGRLGGFIHELGLYAAGIDLVTQAGRLALNPTVPASELLGGPLKLKDGAFFIGMNPAPTVPCRLDAIRGIRDVRSAPGLLGYQVYERPGAQLPGGVMSTALDLFIGTAPDHRAMFPVIDDIRKTLTFTFSDTSGRTWQWNGIELMQQPAASDS